jgi:radical SAM protein with 4Fe4S-binding SPASM domain
MVLQKENEHEMESFLDYWNRDGISNVTFQYEWKRANGQFGGAVSRNAFHYVKEAIPCDIPFSSVIIDVDGNVVPCVTCNNEMDGEIMGNIIEKSLEDVWLDESYGALRSSHLNSIEKPRYCSGCDAMFSCRWLANLRDYGAWDEMSYPVVKSYVKKARN